MPISMKSMLAAAGCAVLAAGCATGPYYDNYGYDYGYGGYAPAYGYPGYVGPSVGIGYGATYYYDRDDDRRRYYRDDRREWRDRDGRRDWRDRDGPVITAPDSYRGPRNHAGEPVGPGYRGAPGSDSPG